MTSFLVIDVETVPTPEALAMAPTEEHLTKGIQSNFKPETVERYRAANLASWPEEIAKKASLDWRLGQLCAIGWAGPDGETVVVQGPERAMLEAFWEAVRSVPQVVGFNLRNFDLPWLVGRSAMHRLPAKRFGGGRYSHTEVVDWADLLSSYGAFALGGWTLEQYAIAFNLDHRPVGSGADVFRWHQDGNEEAIRQHLRADLLVTRDLDRVCRPSFLGAA